MSYVSANSNRDLLAFFGALVAVFGVLVLWMRPWKVEAEELPTDLDEAVGDESNGC